MFYRDVNVQWAVSVISSPSSTLWVAVQVTTGRGLGHIVLATHQTALLIAFVMELICAAAVDSWQFLQLLLISIFFTGPLSPTSFKGRNFGHC